MKRQTHSDNFSIGLTAAFFILNLISVLNHAMWRDEWHVWLIAHYSESLGAMINAISHSGRPAGWYIVAWLVCKMGFYPVGLKVFHVLISTTSVYLLARYSPFTRIQKVLFAFGYFPFYEFGTIMRDYACEVLLLTIAVVLFTQPRPRLLAMGITLALLFQTTVFGIVIGFALGIAYVYDLWWNRPAPDRPPVRALLVGLSLPVLSAAIAVWVMKPPTDTLLLLGPTPYENRALSSRLVEGFSFIWRAYCPLAFRGFWNTNILDTWPALQFTFAVALFAAVSLFLVSRRTALLFFLFATLATVAFFGHFPRDAYRYTGHYFVILILSCWLYYRTADRPVTGKLDWWQRQLPAFLVAVLGVHVIAAALASVQEQVIPFSGSREAAEIIEQRAPGLPVVGDCDFAVAPVAGYLQRPIWIASREEYSTFLKDDDKRKLNPMAPQDLARRVNEFMAKVNSDVVLVVNYQLGFSSENLRMIGAANHSLTDEQYLIYLVRRTPAARLRDPD